MSGIELVIAPRDRDLGGFHVRRVLPFASHRMVGPFVFFDHMGPATFAAGEGMDVRPHPHIHLATVTYLFTGAIHHRDSLGSDQRIEPGAINWMTAGRGIVHSERTPPDLRAAGSSLEGIQCWVALPEEHEETAPTFHHHPASSLPEFAVGGASMKLLLGSAFGQRSPVRVHSDLFYVDVKAEADARFELPLANREGAIYVLEGSVSVDGQEIAPLSMAVMKPGGPAEIRARGARFLLLGGASLGKREIFWNFVSSSAEALAEAKRDWSQGPGTPGGRFPMIPGDDREFIPLPE